MVERLADRWPDRDLPVLIEVVRIKDEQPSYPVNVGQVERALPDLSPDDIQRAAANLERGGYVRLVGAAGLVCSHFVDVTDRALRETGLWPNAEDAADRLLWVLEQKVDQAGDAEERGRWSKIRDAFAGAGRDFTVEVAAAMATRSMGG